MLELVVSSKTDFISLFVGTVKFVVEDAVKGTGISVNIAKLPVPVSTPQEVGDGIVVSSNT